MKKLLLIDCSAIYWRYWHASEDSEVSTAKRQTVDMITSCAREYDYAVLCIDHPPYHRTEIYPDYKAGRERNASAIEQLKIAKKELESAGLKCVSVNGYEADDVIATISKSFARDYETVILGCDKDLLQIENAKLFDPFNRKFKTPEEIFEVKVNQVSDMLALMGDKTDNIPGLSGVGPVRARQILAEIGSVNDFISKNIDEYPNIPDKIKSFLDGNQDQMALSHSLVCLNNELKIELDIEDCKTGKINSNQEAEKVDIIEPEKKENVIKTQIATRPSNAAIAVDNRNANWSLALEPTDLKTAWRIATALFQSRLFGNFANEQAILAIILRGRSLGIDAVTSLSSFNVIEGKPTMSAALIIGLVHKSKKCEFFDLLETTLEKAVWTTKRINSKNETKLEYTIQEAEKAGLLRPTKSGKKSNWQTRPKTMLRWRAGVELARAVYPDVVTGLYTPEEIDESK